MVTTRAPGVADQAKRVVFILVTVFIISTSAFALLTNPGLFGEFSSGSLFVQQRSICLSDGTPEPQPTSAPFATSYLRFLHSELDGGIPKSR